ncbi:MAG: GTPase [Myxococcota bacterium]
MDFQAILKQLVASVPQSVAATLMGYDGIAVSTATPDEQKSDLDSSSLLVEYSSLLVQIKEAAKMFNSGDIKEVMISTERLTVILRVLTEEYFTALVLTPDANIGYGRYKLRVISPKLAAEL